MILVPFFIAAVVAPVGAFKFNRHRLETKTKRVNIPTTGGRWQVDLRTSGDQSRVWRDQLPEFHGELKKLGQQEISPEQHILSFMVHVSDHKYEINLDLPELTTGRQIRRDLPADKVAAWRDLQWLPAAKTTTAATSVDTHTATPAEATDTDSEATSGGRNWMSSMATRTGMTSIMPAIYRGMGGGRNKMSEIPEECAVLRDGCWQFSRSDSALWFGWTSTERVVQLCAQGKREGKVNGHAYHMESDFKSGFLDLSSLKEAPPPEGWVKLEWQSGPSCW